MSGFPAKRAGYFLIFFLLWVYADAGAKGAICLSDSTEILVRQNLTASVQIHKSFEITSDVGIRLAQVIIPFNDFIEARDIKGYTELPDGRIIKITKRDISISSAPGFKGLGGIQAVTVSLRTPTVGSRLYYEYKLEIRSLLYLPRITRRTDCVTKRLVVNLHWEKGVNLRYTADGVESETESRSARFWANDLAEVPDELLSCPDRLQISISTDIFSYARNKYYSRNWPEIGRFFALLSIQPPEVEGELKELAQRLSAFCQNREDTLLALFNFVADSVSYVALQMGKGDFTPHICSVVLSRRFGDCKDQSILLSSLCRAAGFDAYPALVFTGSFPDVELLQPWPAWFDHVVTVVRNVGEDQILDPSDPLGSPLVIPPRLRGKSYLICDSHSELKTAPAGPDPAYGIDWSFHLPGLFDEGNKIEFMMSYSGDAAGVYRDFWKPMKPEKARLAMQDQLSDWKLSSVELERVTPKDGALEVSGRLAIDFTAMGDSHSISLASPLASYLLNNLFPDARKNDYCRTGSLHLEETIIIDHAVPGVTVGPEYSDSWARQGLSFTDQMIMDNHNAKYRRIFDFAGETINAIDYNAFRDFLLSRRDQQYVRVQR